MHQAWLVKSRANMKQRRTAAADWAALGESASRALDAASPEAVAECAGTLMDAEAGRPPLLIDCRPRVVDVFLSSSSSLRTKAPITVHYTCSFTEREFSLKRKVRCCLIPVRNEASTSQLCTLSYLVYCIKHRFAMKALLCYFLNPALIHFGLYIGHLEQQSTLLLPTPRKDNECS